MTGFDLSTCMHIKPSKLKTYQINQHEKDSLNLSSKIAREAIIKMQ